MESLLRAKESRSDSIGSEFLVRFTKEYAPVTSAPSVTIHANDLVHLSDQWAIQYSQWALASLSHMLAVLQHILLCCWEVFASMVE